MSLLDLAANQRWAMRESDLRDLFAIISRDRLDPDLARQIREDRASRMDALSARAGGKLDGTRNVQMRDGVAILDIVGPIVRRADMFSEISGATSVQTLASDLQTALQAPHVDAVLLAIDSPGGEVTGIHEFAQMLMDARTIKPVWAYIEGNGASAAYWIASATERIYAAETADVGWIGVVMALRDPSKTKSDTIEFVSSNAPKKRPDITTEAGRAQVQAMVDATAEVFDASVAAGRGVSVATVHADFGGGGGLIGKAAVSAGMADHLGTFESTLAALRQHVMQRKMRPRMAATQEDTRMADKKPGFWAWIAGKDAPDETDQPPIIEPRTLAPGETLASADLPLGSTARVLQAVPNPFADRLAELESQLSEQQAQARQAQAAAFADGAVRARQAMPSERQALYDAYIQASEDDSARPLTGATRISQIEVMVKSRTPHSLTDELLATNAAGALPNGATPTTPTRERLDALEAMTPLGRATLARGRTKSA